jgi:hypothetical protein
VLPRRAAEAADMSADDVTVRRGAAPGTPELPATGADVAAAVGATPVRMIVNSEPMSLSLMAVRHAATSCDLGAPTRSRAAIWIISLTAFSPARRSEWFVERFKFSPKISLFTSYNAS